MVNHQSRWKVRLEIAGDGALLGVFLLVMLLLMLPPFPVVMWTGSSGDWLNVLLYTACAVAIVRSLYRGFSGKTHKKS